MSCIRLHCLSSMAAGFVAGQALKETNCCGVGFVVVQMLLHIIFWFIRCGKACTLHVDASQYTEHNTYFVQQLSDTMHPRQIVAPSVKLPFMIALNIVGGVSEAAVVILPSTASDVYVVLAMLWTLSTRFYRYFITAIAVCVILYYPVPHGFHLLRGICFIVSCVCRYVQSDSITLHSVCSCAIVLSVCPMSCKTAWAAVSPVTILMYGIQARFHPGIMLTVVLLTCLV